MGAPASYLEATVRCVLPLDEQCQSIAMAFDVPGQPPVRLALDIGHAHWLVICLMRELMPEAVPDLVVEGDGIYMTRDGKPPRVKEGSCG